MVGPVVRVMVTGRHLHHPMEQAQQFLPRQRHVRLYRRVRPIAAADFDSYLAASIAMYTEDPLLRIWSVRSAACASVSACSARGSL